MHNHRRRTFFGSFLPASAWLAPSAPPACGPLTPAELLAQARERTMFVSVLDRDKKPVETLQPEDITIREDNAAREILRIVPATDPLQIALLVDNSQAATQNIQRMRDALTAFVNKVANGTHEISIVTMADRPTLLLDSTKDAKTLVSKGVNRLFAQPGSGMTLLDAIVQTTKGFQKKEAARPVIVAVLTEGAEFSQDHYQTVLDALKNSGTAFYALVLTDGAGSESGRGRDPQPQHHPRPWHEGNGRPPRDVDHRDGAAGQPAVGRRRAVEAVQGDLRPARTADSAEERHGGGQGRRRHRARHRAGPARRARHARQPIAAVGRRHAGVRRHFSKWGTLVCTARLVSHSFFR